MVDKINPTNQFHPYQRESSTPQTGTGTGFFSKIGSLRNVDVRGGLNSGLSKVRGTARSNPGMVLGGLAALAIGAGLMRKRAMSHR